MSKSKSNSKSKQAKALKKLVVKQIKKNYPSFNTHTKKEKKEIIEHIWNQLYNNFDLSTEVEFTKQQLLNIEPVPQHIITIEQMKQLMAQKQTNIIPLSSNASSNYIKDNELKQIYDIVDWNLSIAYWLIKNILLAKEIYSQYSFLEPNY